MIFMRYNYAALPKNITEAGMANYFAIVYTDFVWLSCATKNQLALAAAIKRMFDDPKSPDLIANEGQMLCKTLFDVERSGREIVKIY